MTTAVQHRRGTTSEHSTFTGLEGEVTIDTTKDTAVIHDGALAGGYPLAKENLANVNPGTLGSLDGASTASDDLFVVYDSSAGAMKKITRAELNNAMTLEALDTVDINGGTIDGTAIGATTASTGAFTTLSASSTVSGTGFSTYLASPPAIGGTAAAAGAFTTLTTSSTVTLNGGTANGVTYLNGSKVLTTGSALVFDGSNLGLGVTPSAWGTYKAMQIGATTPLSLDGSGAIGLNYYYDGSAYKYVGSSYSILYSMAGGQHRWYTAPSGTAGNAITFTQAMTLDANGALTVIKDGSFQGVTVGRGAGAVSTNTAVGASALAANTSGAANTAVGESAATLTTTGNYNSVFGRYALIYNTTGSNNTALGSSALFSNTTASSNTAVGYQASYSNTTGTENSSFGAYAGYTNSAGNYNTAVGRAALYSNTGSYNTAVGHNTLAPNTTGSQNTAVGQGALGNNTTASNNTAVGYQAGYSNTTGAENCFFGMTTAQYNTTGYNNSAFGVQALRYNTTGAELSAFGRSALYANTSGSYNTAFGSNALVNNTTASNNTAVGYQALYNCTGANNIAIGYVSGTDAVANITASNNNIVMGNNSHNYAAIKVSWTVTSDARDKTSFAPVPLGLNFVCSLTPTAYQFRVSRQDDTPTGLVRYGFKAQDVLLAEGENPVIIDNRDPDNLKYNQDSMLAVLVNAIKELKSELDSVKAELATLKGN